MSAAARRMEDARAAIDLVSDAGLSLVLRAREGPVRAHLLERLALGERSVLRITAEADVEALTGGIDVMASVAAGQTVRTRSLAQRLEGRMLLVAGAERIGERFAALIARGLDEGAFPGGVVLIDESEPDGSMGAMLADRMAMWVDCDGLSLRDLEAFPPIEEDGEPTGDLVAPFCELAAVLGIASLRAPSHAIAVARALAARRGADETTRSDAEGAVRLALGPRARRMPEEPSEPPPPEPDETPPSDETDTPEQKEGDDLGERLVDAAQAALPAGLLEIGGGAMAGAGLHGSATSRSGGSPRGRRGRLRKGLPHAGARLDLAATLIAAAPMQRLRGRGPGERPAIRTDDIRVRRPVPQRRRATIFAVDASGSAALARLAEVKGAVEHLLAESYVRRDEVGLIAFRGSAAETLLPPTRSLARAKRELQALPGGGGTPLAAGIAAGLEQAARSRSAGRAPLLVVLTDGGANIARDGTPGRAQAQQDAEAIAALVAAARIPAILIDSSARGDRRVEALARSMAARYVRLPRVEDGALAAIVAP